MADEKPKPKMLADMTNQELVDAVRQNLLERKNDFIPRPLASQIMRRCLDAYDANLDTPAEFDDFVMGVVCRVAFWRRGDSVGPQAAQDGFIAGVLFSRRRDVATRWLLDKLSP